MGKCLFCNKDTEKSIKVEGYDGLSKSEQIVFCCSKEHEQEIKKYYDNANEHGKRFIILILLLSLSVCGTIPLAFYVNNLIVSIVIAFLPFVLIGQVIYVYPFATPQSTRKRGIASSVEKTKKLARFIQIISIVLAVLLFIIIKFIL